MTKSLLCWFVFILNVLFPMHKVRDWGAYFDSLYLQVSPCCNVHAHVVACTIMIMTCSREVILAPPPLTEAQSSERHVCQRNFCWDFTCGFGSICTLNYCW